MAWLQTKRNHLQVFGCDAFKTLKCIYRGYGDLTKSYRLFNVSKQKVIHNRDIKYNEEANDTSTFMLLTRI